ncbi:reticulon-3 isoform X2 [Leptidea sinapis]|uniref:reticulon-3 isoform X2 n=1 Tax=Leptidea sinapis TaxID=189913 RepID=UPI0021C48064|nr:reticulon-3 isoform X2 [Leptidea sinapis]
MTSADALLSGLASGDSAPGAPPEPAMKRDQDSLDDFEHLDREGRKVEGSPARASAAVSQSFIDMERAPSATERLEHLADKFTDSESDAEPAESPRRVPQPAPPADTNADEDLLGFKSTEDDAKVIQDKSKVVPEPAPVSPAPAAVSPQAESSSAAPVPTVVPVAAPSPPQVDPAPPAAKVTPREEPPRAPTAHIIEAEVIFCRMGLVESLVYWRCAARSGAALGTGLVLLVALASCSVVSVLAYAALLALSAAVAFRIYKNILQAVQKTNDGHPFKYLLDKDMTVSVERAQALAASTTAHLNAALHELRRLFLVEDLVDSLKFGVLLWCLTYVGACFNGITLIILGWIALFTLPKAYEMNKAQVDANLELARGKINEIVAKVRAAVPLGKKSESEKDK